MPRKRMGRDLVSQFENYGEFRKLGLGVVALRAGELAAGAASTPDTERNRDRG